MIKEPIELEFNVTIPERARAQEFLTSKAVKKNLGIFGSLYSGCFFWAIVGFCIVTYGPDFILLI